MNAWIVYGGWEGHQPREISEWFARELREMGWNVQLFAELGVLEDTEELKSVDLLVPMWTMGTLGEKATRAVLDAVANGMGIAGCHGGMCDAFRENTDWQFMTGGQFVAHPGNDTREYTVQFKRGSSAIVEGLPDFSLVSEQYYMHVDPAIEVLATTRVTGGEDMGPHTANGEVDIPVAWTKRWGKGRVFYCSLGHNVELFAQQPLGELMRRGFTWAARRG
ncbi:MAG TPA: ThuA domain-containing protein [Thermotogota bacterium]|nr:ThuA domain-containing protein [Thermotogota bacterium]HRW92522.1 ThuA domain-containing protein [Thermotogota bacterium]